MLAYSFVDAEASAKELGKVRKTIWAFLESNEPSTRKAAAQSLDLIARCFTPSLITSAINESGQSDAKSTLSRIITQTSKALDSLAYAQALPEVLSIVSSLVTSLRYRDGDRTAPTAAELLLLPLIHQIGELRTQKGFEYKENADAALSTAMRILGPEVLLRILPLNLEPADR